MEPGNARAPDFSGFASNQKIKTAFGRIHHVFDYSFDPDGVAVENPDLQDPDSTHCRLRKAETRWTRMERTYQVTMGVGDTYRFVSEAESWAELGRRGTAPELIRRLFGEKDGARVAYQVR